MHRIEPGRARQDGFTLLEAMVVLVIAGIALAVGMPAMTRWSAATKAGAAVEFYAEGLAMARREALAHNSVSRIMLIPNLGNGQYDWQVDICFPTVVKPCAGDTGDWSSTTAAAAGDPAAASGFRSVRRVAGTLPKSSVLSLSLLPLGNDSIYFTPMGWVDTGFGERLGELRFSPLGEHAKDVAPASLVIGLAGTAIRCDWSVASPDSRACPP